MELPDALFGPLASRIAQRAGLRVPHTQRWLLQSRLQARLASRNASENLGEYVETLLRDNDELDLLVELLRVGETFFYRHPRQLRAIRRAALPEIVAHCEAEMRPMRVWSAGCATGEEAYTLAMLTMASYPDLAVDVLATDLSQEALDRAARGVYTPERTDKVPDDVRSWALEPVVASGAGASGAGASGAGGVRAGVGGVGDVVGDVVEDSVRVADSIRKHVRFERHNLLRDPYPHDLDLVLCRNVLIYFDAEAKRHVLESIFNAVRMHGWVALGYADPIGETQGLEPLRTDEGVLYRRIGTPSVVPPPPPDGSSTSAETTTRKAFSIPLGPPVATLRGEQVGDVGRRKAHRVLAALLESGGEVLDLTELLLADDGVGRELARTADAMRAEGRTLVVEVSSPGIERFLRRHGVVPPARVRQR